MTAGGASASGMVRPAPEVLPKPESCPQPRRPSLLAIVAGMWVLWTAGLAILAVRTANPPQINLLQLAAAREIVVVRVSDPATGQCVVTDQFTPGNLPEAIVVEDLVTLGAAAGMSYVLPLEPSPAPGDSTYHVVGDSQGRWPRLIYPATADVRRQIEAWQSAARQN